MVTRLIPLLVVLAMLAPGAEACHVGLGVGFNQGVVDAGEGPALARISIPNCEGAGMVTITRETAGGPVRDIIAVTMDILGPLGGCLFESCGFGLPIVAFTVRGEGLDLVGVVGSGVHYAIAWSLAGSYADRPATFVRTAS